MLMIAFMMSHPSRVRELKLALVHTCAASVESHPSRVRELKLDLGMNNPFIKKSHPSRVRELKLLKHTEQATYLTVAPLPGA